MTPARLALLPLVLLGGLTAAPLGVAEAADTVQIAVSGKLAHAPWYIARERGYFEREDVAVELVPIGPDDDLYELMDNGDIQLACMSSREILDYRHDGLELSGALLMGTSLEAQAMLTRDDINDVRDLRGKRVGLRADGAGELLLQYMLQRKGMGLDDVERVELAPRDALEALRNGDIAAASSHAPFLPSGDDSELRVLADASISPGLIVDLLAGDPTWIDARRPTVKSLIRAWDDAVHYLSRNPEKGASIIAQAMAVDEANLVGSLQSIEFHDVDDNMELLRGEFQKDFADMGSTLARGNPAIDIPSSGNGILALSPLRQAAAQR